MIPCWKLSVNLFETWVESPSGWTALAEPSVRRCCTFSRSSSGRGRSALTVVVWASSAMTVPVDAEGFPEGGLTASGTVCPYFSDDDCLQLCSMSVRIGDCLKSSDVLVTCNHFSYTYCQLFSLPSLIGATTVWTGETGPKLLGWGTNNVFVPPTSWIYTS